MLCCSPLPEGSWAAATRAPTPRNPTLPPTIPALQEWHQVRGVCQLTRHRRIVRGRDAAPALGTTSKLFAEELGALIGGHTPWDRMAQIRRELSHIRRARSAATCPLIFGRGCSLLQPFALTAASPGAALSVARLVH